jgi:predicted ATPase/class 3 adenylate cyclase
MSTGVPDLLQPSASRELTLLLTDIEGSTALWDRDRDAASVAVRRHEAIISREVGANQGVLIRSRGEGDSTFSVFAHPREAAVAALAITRALAAETWPAEARIRARAAIHAGEVEVRDGDVFGTPINRCARLRALAHGGQVVVSAVVAERLAGSAPEGVSFRDLGVHGLRGLARPERVFQLIHADIDADFPPLSSAESERHNIPTSVTSFIGREHEIAAVRALLGTGREVTLTGVGGAGKTRLAYEVAGTMVDGFADGVWVVELGSVHAAGLVESTVAAVMRIREEPGVPLLDTLVARLRERETLLVLDNCEHVVAAVATLVGRLLPACPGLRILVTSRETLGVRGEQVQPVEALGGAGPGGPAGGDGVRLFLDRARSRRPTFELDAAGVRKAAEIVARVDGIPLAIELAATRAAVLGVNEVADRLDDRFTILTGGDRGSSHETLERTLDWSYELLSEEERTLYARLSVFPARFAVAGAEAIAHLPATFDLLERLIDKSLVSATPGGEFVMLATVRAHAATKLEPHESQATRDRHLQHVLDELSTLTRQQASLTHRLPKLSEARDDVREALAWSLERPEPGDVPLRLVAAMWPLWTWVGNLSEANAWTERALTHRPAQPSRDVAEALRGAGTLAAARGDLDVAAKRFTEALDVARQLTDHELEGWLLNSLGVVADRGGDHARAETLLRESLDAHVASGSRPGQAVTLGNLAVALRSAGDLSIAREMFDRCIALCTAEGFAATLAGALGELGILLLDLGEIDAAETQLREALRLESDLEARAVVPTALVGLAGVSLARGDAGSATALLRHADRMREEMGLALGVADRARVERLLAQVREAMGPRFGEVWETPAVGSAAELALNGGVTHERT